MPYQHILVAIDLTEECHPVVARAQSLASTSNAKLSLVHIIEPMAMAFGGDVPMDLSMLQQQQFDQARERMNGFADSYPASLRKIAIWLMGSLARKCIDWPRSSAAT